MDLHKTKTGNYIFTHNELLAFINRCMHVKANYDKYLLPEGKQPFTPWCQIIDFAREIGIYDKSIKQTNSTE